MGSLYMKSVPTAVLAVPDSHESDTQSEDAEMDNDEDEVWAGMEDAGESDSEVGADDSGRIRNRKASKQKA